MVLKVDDLSDVQTIVARTAFNFQSGVLQLGSGPSAHQNLLSLCAASQPMSGSWFE
jgi:hypothetical protein